MKIKIIDLFKLMLERKAPKKIKVLGYTMSFVETAEWGNYESADHILLSNFRLIDCLNEEVEVIEEDKKIEHCKGYEKFLSMDDYIEYLKTKVDELIDEINKLKED